MAHCLGSLPVKPSEWLSNASSSPLILQYIVKREGLDLTEYGKVDIRAAKRQRTGEVIQVSKFGCIC